MKREPNPYSKNPMLTVTSTMSISVPSMVAEDVLNGTDAPVITTDPEVHGRIDAVSEVVDLMDTRIDAVSNMTELLYGSCVSADEVLSDRIDAVSEVVDLMDISFSTRGGTDYSLGFKADSASDDYSAIVSLKSTGSNEFSGITALRTWLNCPSYGIGDTNVFMAVSGVGTLVFKSPAGMSKYDLSNLGGSSDSTDSKLQIKSGENSDKKTFIVEISKTYRNPVMSLQLYDSARKTSQLYAVAAPWFASSDSSNYGMRIVPDSDLSNMLELTTNGGASWNKLPWPTASEGSSGSSAGVYELDLWDNGGDSGSQMLPLVKDSNIEAARDVSVLNWTVGTSTSDAADASGMYTLIGNPIALYDSAYRAPNDSRIKGAVRVVDMHGTICWQRYSYTAKQWMIEENPSFYWQETNKFSTSIVAVLSYPGYSDKDAVLIDNPLYAGQYNSRPCAVRPYISSDGTLLYWQRRTESGGWTDVKASGTTASTTASTTALCSYATILADRNAETADAVRKGITFGYHAGGDTTTLGYLQFADTLNSANDYKSIIAIEDLLWLGDNINKLKALVN